jgi:hypothetical protein
MNWILLNIPLGVLFFVAITGIPLWMVIKHPDRGPGRDHATGQAATARMTEHPGDLAVTPDRRELVGASAVRARPAETRQGGEDRAVRARCDT